MPVQPYGIFETKDSSIVIAAQRSFEKFCRVLEREELIADARFITLNKRVINRKALVSIVAPILKTRTSAEWATLFEAADIPCAMVNTFDKTFSHPQVINQELLAEHDYVLGGKIKAVGSPIRISDTPRDVREKFLSPPMPGQHTREILTRLLQYSPEKIERLTSKGVIDAWAPEE
jgi:formyl-CoA transferase